MTTTGATIRDILTIVDLGGERRATMVAADLARRTGAHLTGLSLAFDPILPVYTATAPIPTEFITEAHDRAVADAKAASEAFDRIASRAGVARETRTLDSVANDGFSSVIRNAVLTDLAVIGQDNPDQSEPMRPALIEALLFEAALPTVVVPFAGVSEFVPDKAVVAWDGSPRAGRAVRAAMPLLAMTQKVVVALVDEGKRQEGEPGADIGAYLARHDLDVTVRSIANMPGGVGTTLLTYAAEEGMDWMVMGAFGHSRLREFLLGGATRHVLANATLPVLMAH